MKKSYFFALIGLLLGLGSPFGALILLWHFPHPPLPVPSFITSEWQDHFFFFTYMTTGTCLAFTSFGFWLGRGEDQLLQRNRRLTDQVLTDPLTGLGNHRYLHEAFSAEYQRHRISHRPISCVMMDLDHFKRVNDTHGHPFGDLVLKQFGQIITASIRHGDIATRYGGEEFLCVLPNCDTVEALRVAERIRSNTENHRFIKGRLIAQVTVSVGCVTCHNCQWSNYNPIILQADKALYSAKRRGRNRVVQRKIK